MNPTLQRPETGASSGALQGVGLVLGPTAALYLLLFTELVPGQPRVTATAAIAAWMAVWWITEALPLAVTSLLPVVLFPALGVLDGRAVANQYFNHIVFLFVGGFVVALAIERWGLHRRIALRVLLLSGGRPRRLLLGFMVATAFLSMWISNTAAAMMMVTIAVALLTRIESSGATEATRSFGIALLLGVAYAASTGGIATIVGTPPNLSFTRIFEIQFPAAPPISFAAWLLFALPLSLVFLVVIWLFLAWRHLPPRLHQEFHIDPGILRQQHRELGRLTFAEGAVLTAFSALVVLWITRVDLDFGAFVVPGWSSWLAHPEYINDGTVAVAVAVLLFALPARDGTNSRLMDWSTMARMPWHIVLLFGGGFALAYGLAESGLADHLGEHLRQLGNLPAPVLVALSCVGISFLTELTSNTATAEMILPVMAGLGRAIDINPLFLMVPVTISCSCAFMMPVATPPNAIVFGSGRLRILDMVRAGLVLNLVGAILITVAILVLGGPVLDIDPEVMPEWARKR